MADSRPKFDRASTDVADNGRCRPPYGATRERGDHHGAKTGRPTQEATGRGIKSTRVTRTGDCSTGHQNDKQPLRVWRSKGSFESGSARSALDYRMEGKAMSLLFPGVRRALCVLGVMTVILSAFSWVLTPSPSQASNPVLRQASQPHQTPWWEKPTAMSVLPVTLNAPGETSVTVNYSRPQAPRGQVALPAVSTSSSNSSQARSPSRRA